MERLLDQLQHLTPGGYAPGAPPAAEPTAWSAMALAGAGRNDHADRAARWLAELQNRDGSVPAVDSRDGPFWTTSLAIMAWLRCDPARYEQPTQAAIDWLLETEGTKIGYSPHIGHNTKLVGWSWNPATHSWLEPTAFAVLALRQAGLADHSRTREAVELLLDRLLPGGGCNYGNTKVLDQPLLPHLQPSGIVLWALAGESVDDPRIERSLEYIEQQLHYPAGCSSLAYALLGLGAWGRRPPHAEQLIADLLARPHTQNNPHKLALLSLASLTLESSSLAAATGGPS